MFKLDVGVEMVNLGNSTKEVQLVVSSSTEMYW